MPTYEYECLSCDHAFERFQSMKDAPLRKCPQCGKKITRLMGSGAGILFKGTGFYETDYKRSKTTESNSKSDAPAPTPDESKSKKSSEKKVIKNSAK